MPKPTDDEQRPTISMATTDGRGRITGDAFAVRRVMASLERQRELRQRWPQDSEGYVDTRRAICALAQSFPTLHDADGLEPWDVNRFLAWLCGPAPSHGALLAGRFVLGVWNRGTDWREVGRELGFEGAEEALARFDLFEALGCWDEEHCAACRRFMEAPFWP